MRKIKTKQLLPRIYTAILVGFLLVAAYTVLAHIPSKYQLQAAVALSGTKPNIVFILTDDQPYTSVDKMPYVSSRTDWQIFDNAFLNVSLCCVSRATILTGQYDTHTGVIKNPFGPKLDTSETIATWLDAAGYTTGLVGKYLNKYPWNRGTYIPEGWDYWVGLVNGQTHYNYTLNENGVFKKYGSKPAHYGTDVFKQKAIEFIQTAEEPFFLYLSTPAPHGAFEPAPRHKGVYADEPVVLPPNFNEASADKPAYIRNSPKVAAATARSDTRAQWEMLLAIDEAVEAIDDTLAARGISDNTIVIFMTDNGYAHGEHRWTRKRCPYDVCLRTPLLIRYPGLEGKHIPQLVSNIDIAPTLKELAGATSGIAHDGVSLLPLLEGTAETWRTALLNRWGGGGAVSAANPPNFWSVRTDKYRYTELKSGVKELYDYTIDPYELDNKAGDAAYTSIQADLAMQLATLKAAAQAPLVGPSASSRAVADETEETSAVDEYGD